MINKPLRVAILICSAIYTLVPKAWAQKKEFLEDDQIAPKRQNYMLQRACKDEILRNMETTGMTYDIEPFDPDTDSEDLSAFIEDYAVGGNDVMTLEDSFKTRSKKRGTFKVKKMNKIIEDLGDNFFPRYIETRNCSRSQQTCNHPYVCKENLYNLTILKLRGQEPFDLTGIPKKLKYEWVSVKLPVSVGCVCTRDYQTKLTRGTHDEPKWLY